MGESNAYRKRSAQRLWGQIQGGVDLRDGKPNPEVAVEPSFACFEGETGFLRSFTGKPFFRS